jgi:hypothetical protein
VGCVARILSGGETPAGLIESGWLAPIPMWQWWMPPCLPETSGRSDTVRAPTRNPLKIRVGSDPINQLTHR